MLFVVLVVGAQQSYSYCPPEPNGPGSRQYGSLCPGECTPFLSSTLTYYVSDPNTLCNTTPGVFCDIEKTNIMVQKDSDINYTFTMYEVLVHYPTIIAYYGDGTPVYTSSLQNCLEVSVSPSPSIEAQKNAGCYFGRFV